MKKTYSEPWFPNDQKAMSIFLNTNEEDLKRVNKVLNNIQTFIPIINPVFALARNWRIALVSSDSLNWDEYLFSRLEKINSKFNDQEFYWTSLSDLEELSKENYSYKQFYPYGVAKAPLTLENYITIRSSMPYICTETITCFNSNLDVLVYQVSGEYILVAADNFLLEKLFLESQYKGWNILDSEKFFYGDLDIILRCAKAIYERSNMIF